MDLGDCPKVHDLALRADYEQASAQKDYFYDIDVSVCNFIVRNSFENSYSFDDHQVRLLDTNTSIGSYSHLCPLNTPLKGVECMFLL